MELSKWICTWMVLLLCSASAYADSRDCLAAAKLAFKKIDPAAGFNNLGIACAGGSTAQEVTACIPAAKASLDGALGPGKAGLDVVAKACAGGTTMEQVSACIPAAKTALDNAVKGRAYNPLSVGVVCSSGNTAAQAILCIASESSAYDSVLQSQEVYSSDALAQLCAGDVLRQKAYSAEKALLKCQAAADAVDDGLQKLEQSLTRTSTRTQKKEIEDLIRRLRQ